MDLERAERIRLAKKEAPGLTWRSIADACGVSERSAHHWQKDGKISYAHARLFAGYCEVDLDWLWRGPREMPNETSQLDRMEAMLQALVDSQSSLAAEFQHQIEVAAQKARRQGRDSAKRRGGSQR